jgi:hypothetical protein
MELHSGLKVAIAMPVFDGATITAVDVFSF